MYYYKVFGYIFRCTYEIPQLYEITPDKNYDAEIFIGKMPPEILKEAQEETIFPCISWNEDRIWMKNSYGILAVYKTGNIYAKSTSTEDIFYLLQYVLGYGIAMYAHLHNRISIHCSCVAIDNKCILISGDSGAGKSTLTHELIRRGASMLSDDIVAIGYDNAHNPLVFPAFPQQKLCRDVALKNGYQLDNLLYVDPEKDKFAVLHTDKFETNPFPLHTAIYLRTKETPEIDTSRLDIQKVEGFQKVAFLVNNLYLGSMISHSGFSAQAFQLCTDMVKDCYVYQITRPKNADTLNEIVEFLYENLKNKE